MDHPCKKWRDEANFPHFLKDNSRQYLDRDIRFTAVDINDEDDLWKCFRWELFRTLASCGRMPPSLDKEKEFPFYVRSFPNRAYLSHEKSERLQWERFLGQHEDRGEERLLSNWNMNTSSFYHYPTYLLKDGTKKKSNKKERLISFRSKLALELYVNPNWTKSKLKTLFESQIKEIDEQIQWEKKYLEKKRRIIPYVHVEFTPDMKEKKFRQLVQEQTDEICRMVKSGKKYFETEADIFEPKNKSLITPLRSMLKLLGHYRLNYCIHLGWKETMYEFESASSKPLKSEKKFKERISKFFPGLPCN